MAEGEKTYSAGDLNLSIEVLSENALKSLDAVINRLTFIESKFKAISRFTKSLNKSGATKLDKNFKYVYRKDGSISYAIPNKKSNNRKSNNRNSDDSSSIFNLAKITATIYAARRLGGIVANIAQHGANFTESLNLWEVSMGSKLLPQATKFVDKMNEAYGASKETLMNSQAIFKNMLGSLGYISDEQAYILSEGITQMALDYASLYNQTFDQAFTKFQAALAGQVRPIRSVAGYDITEQTLFDLYQSLGGEKSMRQLNRTEKQLLSILAIYQQMERSGATGDLSRTMESFANQSRVAKDQMSEILSYSGALLTNFLETSGIMRYFVGFLIFLSDLLEEVARSTGALENKADPFAGISEGALNANEQIDELQGKLLGFDKFRALDESSNNDIGLDKTLIGALSKYQSILEGANMEASVFGDTLKQLSGLWDEDGTFNKGKWDEFIQQLKDVILCFGILWGASTIGKIVKFIKKVDLLKIAFDLLNTAILAGAVYFLIQAIQAFQDGDTWGGIFASLIGVTLVAAFIALKSVVIDGKLYIELFGKVVNSTFASIIGGIALLSAGIIALVNAWDDMGGWQKAITIITALTAALIGAYVAIKSFSLSVPVALGLGAALAGGVLLVGSQLASNSVTKFANGGLPDKGSMFIAGEAGAEYVYNMPNGQSGVANVQQIAQSTYNGTIKALNDWWGGSQARGDIPQLKEANATGMYQAVTGVAKSYGQKWTNY